MREVVLAFPDPIPRHRNVRSTLLLGGLASIRAHGLGPAYDAAVPDAVRTVIEASVAGMWIPVETAVAHYLTCDELVSSSEMAAKIGRGTFDRTKGLLLGTAIGLAKGAGVTPLTLFPHLQRFWMRGNDGGGVQAVVTGPKEARIDIVGSPLFRSRYFRAAYRGLATGLVELVSKKAYVHELPGGPQDSIAIRIQWV